MPPAPRWSASPPSAWPRRRATPGRAWSTGRSRRCWLPAALLGAIAGSQGQRRARRTDKDRLSRVFAWFVDRRRPLCRRTRRSHSPAGVAPAKRPPHLVRRDRHVEMAHAERAQRIEHGIGDRRRRAVGRQLADALQAEEVVGRGRGDGLDLQRRARRRRAAGRSPSGCRSAAGRSPRRRRLPPSAHCRARGRCRHASGPPAGAGSPRCRSRRPRSGGRRAPRRSRDRPRPRRP